MQLMDIVEGTIPGKLIWIGKRWTSESFIFVPDQQTFEKRIMTSLCTSVFDKYFTAPHGLIYGTDLRRVPNIEAATWAICLRWPRYDRSLYSVKYYRPKNPLTFSGDYFTGYSTLVLYSFDHQEELEREPRLEPDWSDISTIPPLDDDSEHSQVEEDQPPPLPPPKSPPQVPPHLPPDQPQNDADISDFDGPPPDWFPSAPNDRPPIGLPRTPDVPKHTTITKVKKPNTRPTQTT